MEFDSATVKLSLRFRRHTLGLTQKQLADKAGISVETMGRIENLNRRASHTNLHKVDDALTTEEAQRIVTL